MALGKRNSDASDSDSPVSTMRLRKRPRISYSENTRKPFIAPPESKAPIRRKYTTRPVLPTQPVLPKQPLLPTQPVLPPLPPSPIPYDELNKPVTGKRKADDVADDGASEQPDSKRRCPSPPVKAPSPPRSPRQQKKAAKKADKKGRVHEAGPSNDEHHGIPGWTAEDEMMYQSAGGRDAAAGSDPPLPIYYAMVNREFSDRVVARMTRDYMAAHPGALEGDWKPQAHAGCSDLDIFYPPPLWLAVVAGRLDVVATLLDLGARHDLTLRVAPRDEAESSMYDYVGSGIAELLTNPAAGVHATFDERMDAIESCMLWVADRRRDWLPHYNTTATATATTQDDDDDEDAAAPLDLQPLLCAGFHRMLNRLQVREGMGPAQAEQDLEDYFNELRYARKADAVLGWFRNLPEHCQTPAFQRKLDRARSLIVKFGSMQH